MATTTPTPPNKLSLFPLLSLLCFISIFFLLSLSKRASLSSPHPHRSSTLFPPKPHAASLSCDFSHGSWIYDPNPRSATYDGSCKEIFKGWNCLRNNKTNALEISKWRWKPKHCDLPSFDPLNFLETHRDTNIGKHTILSVITNLLRLIFFNSAGFVGDSLNRNMFVSLFCTLKTVTSDLKKWRPAGADRGFTFLRYNLTIAYHRTNLLARYAGQLMLMVVSWKLLDSKRDIELMLMFLKAHGPRLRASMTFSWWAPSKFDPLKSPMLFFEGGRPILPPLPPADGLDRVLSNMVNFVEKTKRPGGILFFRTQSPRHFEGGDWNEGGTCQRLQPLVPREVEELFSVRNNGTNVEVRLVNQHLYNSLENRSGFHVLDITQMSEYRADAHPATSGGKNHDDCMHWCLPGLTDTWNDLFVATLGRIKGL
ncbi:hypothetical protein IGI04_012586 [Brassica rapa subsp. trilocularis]|uniref:Trichome birefringence-like N-terminal domain-containing protein n=1 Tax=Brassica rapa subsp. trilocularis TaxID=1813537 RepID=A0ABQ7N6B3_BRACM|nr:hypothetical protein IGI04_012586 [Brassica rapa subsp. trilocularis]